MAQKQEQLVLRQKQRDWLKVLHEMQQGHLAQAAGGEQLGVSERWVREMVRRLKRRGDRAVVHGLAGKRSKRRIGKAVQQRAVRLYQREYADFGPTQAAEYLTERHGLKVSKETLRKWLVEAGAWQAEPRQLKQVLAWRPRRSCRGELVQCDTSIHDWLEGRRREPVKLIAMIDDASNELFARSVSEDPTAEHMRVLWQYLERYGRPQAFYTDKAGLFRVNGKRSAYGEEGGPQERETQIGRALRELGIELIHAHSPQAKGRVERCFGTLQDRLVKGLRKACVNSLEGANQYLEKTFLPQWKQRFCHAPASAVDAHRELGEGHDLASALSYVESRRVTNDYTVSWHGQPWQIPRAAVRPGLRSATVRVEQRLDGSVWARGGEHTIELTVCERQARETLHQPVAPGRRDHNRDGRSQWMKGFDLSKGWPIRQATRIANQTG